MNANDILEGQRTFILTRDMVPISFAKKGAETFFICPLPRGCQMFIQNFKALTEACEQIKNRINEKARKQEPPFENILFGFGALQNDAQKKILDGVQISRVLIDENGVSAIHIGTDAMRSDVYLTIDTPFWYDFTTQELFKEFFEQRTAFMCGNINILGHALVAREFCVEYFNMINRLILRDKK